MTENKSDAQPAESQETPAPKVLTFKERSPQEIKEMARDFYKGKIFCHLHVPMEEADEALRQIFMPLAMGSLHGYKEEDIAKIGLVFEYLEKAGPTAFGNYPVFMSYQLASQEQADQIFALVRKYEEFEDQMMKG